MISVGGVKNKIVRCETDGKTPVWEYVLKKNINHKGFEYISLDGDFNNDKVNDVFLIVNSYDSKDSKVYSQFIILNGASGKVLVDKNVITATYYDENWNKITQYLTGSSLSVLKDIDWDGVKELVVDGNVVSSRRNEVVGSNQGYIETDGVPLEVGDANGDGFSDYVVITKAETRLYLSKYSYSYGVLEVSYTKTGSVFPNPAKADAMYSSIIFGDVNNDGQVTVADVMLLLNYALGHNPTMFNEANADVNDDDNISISDVMVLLKMVISESESNPS